MTNAEIAAALEELGVLYELDGAVKYRVLAYSDRRQGDPRKPGLGRRAGRPGGRPNPRRRQDAGGKIDALLETGEIPAAVKLKAKFPPTLIEVTRVPGRARKPRAASSTSSESPRSRT